MMTMTDVEELQGQRQQEREARYAELLWTEGRTPEQTQELADLIESLGLTRDQQAADVETVRTARARMAERIPYDRIEQHGRDRAAAFAAAKRKLIALAQDAFGKMEANADYWHVKRMAEYVFARSNWPAFTEAMQQIAAVPEAMQDPQKMTQENVRIDIELQRLARNNPRAFGKKSS